MDVRSAFNKMKSRPGLKLHFFYCEQGPNGKPVLLMDTKAIPKDEKDGVLKTAKKKGKAGGLMEMSPEGELNVTPKGSPHTSLAKGVQIAARNNNCMPKAINIGGAEPEDAEPEKTALDEKQLETQQKGLVAKLKGVVPKLQRTTIAPTVKDAVLKASEAGVALRKKEPEKAAALLQEAEELLQSALREAGKQGIDLDAPPSVPSTTSTDTGAGVVDDDEDEDEESPSSGGKVGGYNPSTGLYEGKRPKKPSTLKGTDEVGDALTAHHVYPWNKILKDINDALSTRSKDKLEKLLKFGEHTAPSWFLDEVALPPAQRRGDFGTALNDAAKAICWSPANIFMGPLNTKRGDDPGSKLDTAYTQSGLPTPSSALGEMIDKKGGIGTDDGLTNLLSKNIREAQEGQPRRYEQREWVEKEGTGKRVARKKVPIKPEGGMIPEEEDKEWSPAKGQRVAPKQESKPKMSEEEIQRRRKEAEENKKRKEEEAKNKPKDDDDEGGMGGLFDNNDEEEN
ncbi:MAG: hypothetical protein L0Y71_21035 [Gemmataceae bacterium]|nr:hypothetical protein [Gemmataceae bacterium]